MVLVLGAAACGAIVAGIEGRPLPSKFGDSNTRAWEAFGPGAATADAYLWYAAAASAITLGALLLMPIVRPGRHVHAVTALELIMEIAWVAALVLIVSQWVRGEPYANFLLARLDFIDYLSAIVLTLIVLGLLAFIRVRRFQAVQRASK
jgi:hypothetical protein